MLSTAALAHGVSLGLMSSAESSKIAAAFSAPSDAIPVVASVRGCALGFLTIGNEFMWESVPTIGLSMIGANLPFTRSRLLWAIPILPHMLVLYGEPVPAVSAVGTVPSHAFIVLTKSVTRIATSAWVLVASRARTWA
jgi:hypothetical protein